MQYESLKFDRALLGQLIADFFEPELIILRAFRRRINTFDFRVQH
jgi:hypothetical protein